MPEQMIYTSYFAGIRKLPPDVVPIAICRKVPEGYKGLQYRKLMPPGPLLQAWKENHDEAYYKQCFKEQVLDLLDPDQVAQELKYLSKGRPYALICYEKPDDFCHRHLVAEWLKNAGYKAKEYVELPEKEKLVKE